MPTPSAKLLAVLSAGAVTVAVIAFSACSGSDGITPTCTYNVDDAGNIEPSANGCIQFASCEVGNGDPANCCVDADGGPLVGADLADCLYGYGACPVVQTDDAGNVTCSNGAGGGGTGGSGAGGSGAGGSGTGGSAPDAGGPDGGDAG
jgi:hypothetical protein